MEKPPMSAEGAFNLVVELRPSSCGDCGIIFALTTAYYDCLRTEVDTFYCPNGHANVLVEEISNEERGRLRLLAALDQAEAAGRPRGRRRR